MKKQGVVTTYAVYLDYYVGGALATRLDKFMAQIGTRGVVFQASRDAVIITAANNVLNATEISNLLIKYFDEHYTIKNMGEVSC